MAKQPTCAFNQIKSNQMSSLSTNVEICLWLHRQIKKTINKKNTITNTTYTQTIMGSSPVNKGCTESEAISLTLCFTCVLLIHPNCFCSFPIILTAKFVILHNLFLSFVPKYPYHVHVLKVRMLLMRL